MKRIVTTLAIAAAMAIGVTSRAEAQTCSAANQFGPYCIDGQVTDGANSKPSGAALKSIDGNGNLKELGPDQGSDTKFPVIHTAVANMLGTSNPNGQTDLNTVYSQTEKDANGKSWFYFGWVRDANSGSGFISFEAHQVNNDCESYSPEDLALCNPWAPRTIDDFVIFWDQSGGSTNVYLRKWNGSNWTPAQPGLLLNTLKDPDGNPVVSARYSSDGFRGEMSLNLTGAGLVGVNECRAFANVIPGTITGNSPNDQADYKDVVLEPISINTCGGITVNKVTLNADGKTLSDTTTTFGYTIGRGGAALNANGDTSVSDSVKGCTASDPSPCGNTSKTHSDLLDGSGYTLTENAPIPGGYVLFKDADNKGGIVCGTTDITTGGTFSVPSAGTITCTIKNILPKGNPQLTTTPVVKALLYDSVDITLERKLPNNTTVTGVKFELFKNSVSCATGAKVGERTADVLFVNGISGSATTSPTPASNNAPPAFLVIASGDTYYWKVTYPGDSLNDPAVTCGEATLVTWSFPSGS